jgi:hypothetical protein
VIPANLARLGAHARGDRGVAPARKQVLDVGVIWRQISHVVAHQIAKRAGKAAPVARAPSAVRPRFGKDVRIMFWNLRGSPALENAIRAHAAGLPKAPSPWTCRVSLTRATLARSGDLTAATGFQTEVHLSSFAEGLLAGWKVVVRSHHDDLDQSVRAAFRAAARVLRSGRIRPVGRSSSTTVQLQSQDNARRGSGGWPRA